MRTSGTCNTTQGATCDCDLNEWGTWVADFYEGTGWEDGNYVSAGNTPWVVDAQSRKQNSKTDEDKEMMSIEERLKRTPEEKSEHRRRQTALQIQRLEDRGQVKGKDFIVSDDGLSVFSICP